MKIKVIFYVTGREISYKKAFCRGIEQVRETGRRKKMPFLF